MSALPSVAIVILNWNGQHYLQQFLPSVLASGYGNLQIIVADNASTDNSVAYLNEHFPTVHVILLPQNYGFAKGYNEALKKVQSDYYILLNSDVEVTKGWIEPIIEVLEKDKNAAACQPKLLAYKNKRLFEYAGAAGGWIDSLGYPFARGRIFDYCEEDHSQYNATEEVFWASGAALVIKSEAYHLVQGFDARFFAHQEEIDLCWRLQLAGKKIYCCPQSVVYHVGGGTLPRGNSRKTFLNFRNNLMMLYKNLPWSEKWWKIPYRLSLDDISALKGLLSGDGGYFIAILKAHIVFLYWLFFERHKHQQKPKPMHRLSGVFTGNIVWRHFVKQQKTFSAITGRK